MHSIDFGGNWGLLLTRDTRRHMGDLGGVVEQGVEIFDVV